MCVVVSSDLHIGLTRYQPAPPCPRPYLEWSHQTELQTGSAVVAVEAEGDGGGRGGDRLKEAWQKEEGFDRGRE